MMKGKRQGGGKDGVDNLIGEAALNNFVNSDGSVTINVNEFLKLVRHASAHDRADDPKPSPVPWQVVGLDVNAETSASCVSFTCDFVVRSFSQDWVKVPLLPASYAFDKFSVSGPQPVGTNSTDGGVAADSSATEDIQADGRQPSVVGSAGDVSVLLPSPGDYTVSISGLAPFQNERKSGFQLTIKTDVLRSSLSCTVHSSDLDIKVDPALSTVSESLPATPASTSGSTKVTCLLGNFKCLSVQWTARQPEEEETDGKDLLADEPTAAAVEEVKKEPLIVCNHSVVHTIGEGTVSTNLSMEYEIHHTTKAVFDILCPALVNIIDVTGANIKRWKVLHGPPAPGSSVPVADRAADLAPSDSGIDAEVISLSEGGSVAAAGGPVTALNIQPGQKAIRVMLHYPVQGRHGLAVTADLPMESTSCAVSLPVFDAAGSTRQKGYVGVEARTNVEVREVKKVGVARVDVSELPGLMTRAGKSYLHAYKFLIPRYQLDLDVKRHADAEVLTAVIEEAWLTATVSESGSSLARVLLAVRNTQRQFLRITLPESPGKKADIWSAMVNGVAVKPAVDDSENTVLVPLLKAGDADAKASNSLLYVELVFLESVSAMLKAGKLSLSFSRFDLPVQRLFVTTYLPNNYTYGQFEGDLKEVKAHGKPPPRVNAANAPSLNLSLAAAPRPRKAKRQQNSWNRQRRGSGDLDQLECEESLDSCDDNEEIARERRHSAVMTQAMMSNFMFDEEEQREEPEALGGALDRGVVPVAIKAMQEGTPFCFERLLVQNESYTVTVPYKQIKVGVRDTGWANKCSIM
mmetsp:Transcript_36280/g.85285  ORF Transcript_36280/g.85285 Transcript_36280/m.85285 type:complete len:804 (-) Transcript_36280:102-2513(-)